MAGWDQVRRLALALPESSERSARGSAQWRVREKLFVWERPLRPREAQELSGGAPHGPILAARVEHLGAKQALVADACGLYFTTSHFDGYPAVLVRLDQIGARELRELIIEAWLCRAPRRLARQYIEDHPPA